MTTITFSLPSTDVFQILDALNNRADAWEKTGALINGSFEPDDIFIPEECDDAQEAMEIAKHFRDIAANLEGQLSQVIQQS
jgi:hypothetical protein